MLVRAAALPASAARRVHFRASGQLCGAPSPLARASPKAASAVASPASAAAFNKAIACSGSRATPSPRSNSRPSSRRAVLFFAVTPRVSQRMPSAGSRRAPSSHVRTPRQDLAAAAASLFRRPRSAAHRCPLSRGSAACCQAAAAVRVPRPDRQVPRARVRHDKTASFIAAGPGGNGRRDAFSGLRDRRRPG